MVSLHTFLDTTFPNAVSYTQTTLKLSTTILAGIHLNRTSMPILFNI